MNDLKKIYYNLNNPASFASVYKLHKAGNSNLKDTQNFLSGELTYSLHKYVRNNFKREKIFVTQPFEQYQADLVDMKNFSRVNKGFKYILTVIDCFSKYAFAVPVKNKTGVEIKRAFEIVFENEKPFKLQTDRGTEFKNQIVQKYLKENNIIYFNTYNTQFKCAIVERFNRTLQEIIYKYFTYRGNNVYIDILQNIVDKYNSSYHRTIKIEPKNVNFSNRHIVFQNIYGYPTPLDYLASSKVIHKLKPGDKVRRKYLLTPMDKGYFPKWSDEIYTIERNINGVQRPLYKIANIKERLYPEELQKVNENLYRVEKVIKRENRDGIKGFIVKWLNYPTRFNSWIPEQELINLQ